MAGSYSSHDDGSFKQMTGCARQAFRCRSAPHEIGRVAIASGTDHQHPIKPMFQDSTKKLNHVSTNAGDMPVVLTHDGPSLGGFVCPVTIASTQLWKIGQASPMDAITFHALTLGNPELGPRTLREPSVQSPLLSHLTASRFSVADALTFPVLSSELWTFASMLGKVQMTDPAHVHQSAA